MDYTNRLQKSSLERKKRRIDYTCQNKQDAANRCGDSILWHIIGGVWR